MFGKGKKALLGGRIPPDCAYCRHNSGGEGGGTVCALRRTPSGNACRKYRYDPLRRVPRPAPGLKKDGFTKEDFKL